MRVSTRLSSLAACLVLLSGCNKKTPVAVPVVTTTQPSPSILALQTANKEFSAGNFTAATREYERYLELVPTGSGDGDHALFHLGLIYSLPQAGWQDWPRANGYFNSLIKDFPQSSYTPAAQLILSMRDQAAQLSAEISRLTTEAAQLRTDATNLKNQGDELRNEASQLRANSTQLNEQIAKMKTESDQLQMDLEKKEQRIRQLTTELERLIRIESERRPRL